MWQRSEGDPAAARRAALPNLLAQSEAPLSGDWSRLAEVLAGASMAHRPPADDALFRPAQPEVRIGDAKVRVVLFDGGEGVPVAMTGIVADTYPILGCPALDPDGRPLAKEALFRVHARHDGTVLVGDAMGSYWGELPAELAADVRQAATSAAQDCVTKIAAERGIDATAADQAMAPPKAPGAPGFRSSGAKPNPTSLGF